MAHNRYYGRSWWGCGLTRSRFTVAGLLGSRIRIPLTICLFAFCFLYFVQVAASATSWSLIQRSPTGCVCLIVCGIVTSKWSSLSSSWSVGPQKESRYYDLSKCISSSPNRWTHFLVFYFKWKRHESISSLRGKFSRIFHSATPHIITLLNIYSVSSITLFFSHMTDDKFTLCIKFFPPAMSRAYCGCISWSLPGVVTRILHIWIGFWGPIDNICIPNLLGSNRGRVNENLYRWRTVVSLGLLRLIPRFSFK